MSGFRWSRWLGVMLKEFIQLRRDRLTFAMIVGIPLMQLMLFGFAINSDPKHLPTAVVIADPGPVARSFTTALQNSGYFEVVGQTNAVDAEGWLRSGQVQFVVTFPAGFHKHLARGEAAPLLVQADGTDPQALGGALNVLQQLVHREWGIALANGVAPPQAAPIALTVHRWFNPEGITSHHIVPGLLGVILTLTMVLMTGLAMTRERERGTFEQLLATPATPLEIITGKITPYILVGFTQVLLIVMAARLVFQVPLMGSVWVLLTGVLIFIVANLTLGIVFSSLARNQLQAMQLTVFFFLPSILLSGFMFPFRGMPVWAQWLGNALPLTHFLRLVRAVMLKGSDWLAVWPHIWPLLLFIAVVMVIGLRSFKNTLD
jgi:ABC-2 type transport system permease protein